MIKKTTFLLSAVLMVTLLTACGGKEAAEDPIVENPTNTTRVCPALKDPVCAELNGEKMTFDNGCEANKAGSKTWTRGEC